MNLALNANMPSTDSSALQDVVAPRVAAFAAVPRLAWIQAKGSRFFALLAGLMLLTLTGCQDDMDTVRKIQAARQTRMQSETKVDHLGEAMSLTSRWIELDPTTASRQVVYHLNAWQTNQNSLAKVSGASDDKANAEISSGGDVSQLVRTISELIPAEEADKLVTQSNFVPLDVFYLRYVYLLKQLSDWVRDQAPSDPLWQSWLDAQAKEKGADHAASLGVSLKLFDWVVRNVAIEPLEPTDGAPAVGALPLGMKFRGPGYRQTPYLTLFRGTGDGWQRSILFSHLCRQASLRSCLLATTTSTGELQPWLVGVLIGGEIYLFDCSLGLPVPGPDQQGVATLTQARRDASVLRRLNVPGWFEYPIQKDNVQQCAALLIVEPETICRRFQSLEQGLVGDNRMILFEDIDATAAELEQVNGVATVRIWDVPLKSRVYEAAIEEVMEKDPLVAFYMMSQWAILDGQFDQAKRLSLGRWRHLRGEFSNDEDEAKEGAKTLYLSQRQPEFEIADLRIDVELQKQYGIRRELGVTPEIYDRQIQQVQTFMRQGKLTATYWLGLIQYDTSQFEMSSNWFKDRVLDVDQPSRWIEAARYNLARSYEAAGQFDKAIELYRTVGDIQEHGNRIRARLVAKLQGQDAAEQDTKD